MAISLGFRATLDTQQKLSAAPGRAGGVRVLPADVQSVDASGFNPTRLGERERLPGRPDRRSEEVPLALFVWNQDLGVNGQTVARVHRRGKGATASSCAGTATTTSDAPVDSVLASHFGTRHHHAGRGLLHRCRRGEPGAQRDAGRAEPAPARSSSTAARTTSGSTRTGASTARPATPPSPARPPTCTRPAGTSAPPSTGTTRSTTVARRSSSTTSRTCRPGRSPVRTRRPPATRRRGRAGPGRRRRSPVSPTARATRSACAPRTRSARARSPTPSTSSRRARPFRTRRRSAPRPRAALVAGQAAATWSLPPGYNNGGTPLTGFRLYAQNQPNPRAERRHRRRATTTGHDHRAADNTQYQFQVTALNSNGESSPSAYSNIVLTLPGKPGTPTATYAGPPGPSTSRSTPPSGGNFSDLTNVRAHIVGIEHVHDAGRARRRRARPARPATARSP